MFDVRVLCVGFCSSAVYFRSRYRSPIGVLGSAFHRHTALLSYIFFFFGPEDVVGNPILRPALISARSSITTIVVGRHNCEWCHVQTRVDYRYAVGNMLDKYRTTITLR